MTDTDRIRLTEDSYRHYRRLVSELAMHPEETES